MTDLHPFEIKGVTADKPKQCNWKPEEQIRFAIFIDLFEENYRICVEKSNNWKFWRILALFVQSKNPNQCRIYHKRLINQHHSINSIILFFSHNIKHYQYWQSFYRPMLLSLYQAFMREREAIRKQVLISFKEKQTNDCPSMEDALNHKQKETEKNQLSCLGLDEMSSVAISKQILWRECHLSFLKYLTTLNFENHKTQ